MGQRYFTSDLHVGHENIWRKYCRESRPFSSTQAMNEAIVLLWNETVSWDDEVWVLGDVAMGRLDDSLAACARLQGTRYLVPGNHDRVWRGSRNGPSRVEEYEAAGFVIVDEPAPLEVAGTTFALNHFPYEWDERHGGKHAPHHPPDEGEWLLHGNVHDLWRQRGRQINVGLDAWGRLLSEEDIAALVAGGERTLMGGQPGPFTDSPLADR